MQLMAHCTTVCPVPPRCFQPPPKVQSEVIQIDPLPLDRRLPSATARRVESLLKQTFLSRRKMLRNTLASLAPESQLQALAAAAGFDLQQRPQELAPQVWVALARGLNQGIDAASADGHDHGDGTGQGESSSGGAGDPT
jgi:16S rRNA (adenine1518-N6/adenine1519-N6)-dimethyltransferase